MTPRERWLALLNKQKPDRIPTDIWATAEVYEKLYRHLGVSTREDLCQKLHIDAWNAVYPRQTVTAYPYDPNANIWGLRFKPIDYGSGVYYEAENHPLAPMEEVEELDSFRWPNPEDYDWDDYARDVAAMPQDRLICGGHYEPFLLYCWMRGMEQAMMDLVANPEFLTEALRRIFEYNLKVNTRIWELAKGKVDIMYMAEDLGSQNSLLMRRDHILKFILPNQKRMADAARSHGVHIFYHTDGAARNVIGDLIDITGIEILNPLQWRCPGMALPGLAQDFGSRVVFHGGVDNQRTLPYGSAQEVREEVLCHIDTFKGYRWICAPCHNLQPVSPVENIIAMYETVHEHGKL